MRIIISCFLLCLVQLASSQENFKIVSSASIIMDMAEHILGDKHEIELIVPIGGDPKDG